MAVALRIALFFALKVPPRFPQANHGTSRRDAFFRKLNRDHAKRDRYRDWPVSGVREFRGAACRLSRDGYSRTRSTGRVAS